MDFAGLLERADVAVRACLGSTVVYAPATGAPVSVAGVFDRSYLWLGAGEPGVSTSTPAVFLRLSELPEDPSIAPPASITVGGVAYVPRAIEPDGLGGVMIVLHKAAL